MKTKAQNDSRPVEIQEQHPVFHKVAENLYRLESSGGYYALLKRGGKQFRRSLKTKDRKLADRRLAELRQKVGCLQISPEAKLSFAQAANYWLETIKHSLSEGTLLRRTMYIKGLAPFLGALTIRNITPENCDHWVKERGPKLAAETFNHELDVMKNVFEFAEGRGLILANPAKHVKRRKVIADQMAIPSREQFKQLVSTIRLSDGRKDSQQRAKTGADLVEFLAYTGARIGEVTGGSDANEKRPIRWSDINIAKGTIFLPGTKTESAPRTNPMSEKLRQFIEQLNLERQPQPGDTIIPIKSARKCLQTACKKLGLPSFTHHDFRDFFATTCIEQGVDIPTVSRWLGHKDGGALAMKRYGHLRQEHSQAMMKKVNFDELTNVVPKAPSQTVAKDANVSATVTKEKRSVAKAKAKYRYPWWASKNSAEVFWGQLNEPVQIVPSEKLRLCAKETMGREVFEEELEDHNALKEELIERVPKEVLDQISKKIAGEKQDHHQHAAQLMQLD